MSPRASAALFVGMLGLASLGVVVNHERTYGPASSRRLEESTTMDDFMVRLLFARVDVARCRRARPRPSSRGCHVAAASFRSCSGEPDTAPGRVPYGLPRCCSVAVPRRGLPPLPGAPFVPVLTAPPPFPPP